MILLSFLPRAIMKLFYKRAAVPIIQIIPSFLQCWWWEERRNACSVPSKGGTAQEGSGGCAWSQGLTIGAGTPVTEQHGIYQGL